MTTPLLYHLKETVSAEEIRLIIGQCSVLKHEPMSRGYSMTRTGILVAIMILNQDLVAIPRNHCRNHLLKKVQRNARHYASNT